MRLSLLAGPAVATERGVSDKALAQAARDARLDQIDVFKKDCGDKRRVEDWLKQLVGDTAKSIQWSGGRCQIVNKLSPIDAGTDWCGHANYHIEDGEGVSMIEVFFEKPANGKPGVPFAFRGAPQDAPNSSALRLRIRTQLEDYARPWLQTAGESGLPINVRTIR